MSLIIPDGYSPKLSVRETEKAIKMIKDTFETRLAENLHLHRLSAPLFVFPESGLNDDLSGVERPVRFEVKGIDNRNVDIVHSLAKWKRVALHKYHFVYDEGIYTDMNAIRRDDDLDNLHSIYVDQWDWEKIILKEERNDKTLENIVRLIYKVLKETEKKVLDTYSEVEGFLPEDVTFMTSQELLDMYPDMSAKEREDEVCKKYGAVFISRIGCTLSNGESHDSRSPDYDDWSLNGDMLLWYPVLGRAMEITSMGIRVDEDTLVKQLEASNHMERLKMPYHQDVLNKVLPYTIGGGIGQSRLCMYFLNKAHIGEVQAAVWSEEMITTCDEHNIHLL